MNKTSIQNDENEKQDVLVRRTRSLAKHSDIEPSSAQAQPQTSSENTLKLLDMNSSTRFNEKIDKIERQVESINKKLTKAIEEDPVVRHTPIFNDKIDKLERHVESISNIINRTTDIEPPIRQTPVLHRQKTLSDENERVPSRVNNELLNRTSVLSTVNASSISRSNSLSTPDKFAARLHNYGLLNNKATNHLEATKIIESIATPARMTTIEPRMQTISSTFTSTGNTFNSNVSRRTAAPTNLYKTSTNSDMDRTRTIDDRREETKSKAKEMDKNNSGSSMANFKFFLYVALFTVATFYIWIQLSGKI